MKRSEMVETAELLRRVLGLVESGELEAPQGLLLRMEAAAVALEEVAGSITRASTPARPHQ